MKNLIAYYFKIFLPLLLLAAGFKFSILPPWILITILLIYVLFYRTFLDGQRLIVKGLIKKEDRWKVITHGLRSKYFRELYLER